MPWRSGLASAPRAGRWGSGTRLSLRVAGAAGAGLILVPSRPQRDGLCLRLPQLAASSSGPAFKQHMKGARGSCRFPSLALAEAINRDPGLCVVAQMSAVRLRLRSRHTPGPSTGFCFLCVCFCDFFCLFCFVLFFLCIF